MATKRGHRSNGRGGNIISVGRGVMAGLAGILVRFAVEEDSRKLKESVETSHGQLCIKNRWKFHPQYETFDPRDYVSRRFNYSRNN